MTVGSGGPRVRGTRSARHTPREQSPIPEIVVAVVIAVAATTYAAIRAGDLATETPPGPAPADAAPSKLAALTITGATVPFVSVVGTSPTRGSSVLVLPPTLSFTAPGYGDATVMDVAAFPADPMRVAVSNAVGAWAEHYGVLDLDGLGRLVDRAGGITIELAEPTEAGPDVLGPGPVSVDGATVVTLLFESGRAAALERFTLVVRALLEDPPRVRNEDLVATDDAGEFGRVLRAARGADVTVPPTHQVAGTVTAPDQPAFDRYVGDRFGTPTPIRAIVENGSGEPAVGEAVARKLIPAGFRIVLSGNAESFDHERTDILAEGTEHIDAARVARRALGVGRVGLSQVPSGIGDITIVVGKDFNG